MEDNSELDIIPPNNIDAEAALLGSCMIDKDCIDRLDGMLSPEDFYKYSHQLIFESMLYLYAKETPIDIQTLTARLKSKRVYTKIGGAGYLAGLANAVPTASNAIHYAKLISECSLRRKLLESSQRIKELAYNEKVDIDEVLESSDKSLSDVMEWEINKTADDRPDDMLKLASEYDELYDSGKDDTIKMCFKPLEDEFIGLHKGEILSIQAPSGGKKSLFALNLSYNMAKEGRRVLYVNLEMNKNDITERLLCISSGLDSYMVKGRKFVNGEVSDALAKLSDSKIRIVSPAIMTISQLYKLARMEQKKNGLDVLIVDHIHLISSKIVDPVQRVGEAAEGLKKIARKLDIPIIQVAQINRVAQLQGSKPSQTDVRDSSKIENTAGTMLALTNSSMPSLPTTKDEDEVIITVVKNRYGRSGYEIPIIYNWRNLQFYGKSNDNYGEGGFEEIEEFCGNQTLGY